MLVPVPRQRTQRRPAGNQCRVDPQLGGAPVASLAQEFLAALFSRTRPLTRVTVTVGQLGGGQIQSMFDSRQQTVPATSGKAGWEERCESFRLRGGVRQGDEDLMGQDEVRRPVCRPSLGVAPGPKLSQDGQTAAV